MELIVYAFLAGFILGGAMAVTVCRSFGGHIHRLQDRLGDAVSENAELKGRLNVAEKRLKHYMEKCRWLEKRQ